MTLWTWEHAVLWLAAAAACWLAVLSGGCSLIPQSAVAPVPVVRPVTVMERPWWADNADAFVRSREPVE
jgi:hypothetical protein